ncbi:XRE family transcriptional regulator [Acutalibacter intestini]|uniref:XRE family transcriptional regulator n=1 Tax=Acutalibacter intestini TaxID=3093659 RepID=UPI002AC9867D|nr:XRE family transcriptional regulator [Acutalibacter sp. M00204]
MIGQNIQAARKAKGLSQEELAVRLNVVRQTVSKWEKGLSAPDADQLVLLAHALETPVDRLLGIPPQELSGLEEERERILQEFSLYRQRDARRALLERKRGRLLALSFAAMLAALAVRRPVVSLLLTGGCALGALALLYKDLPLLTESAQEQKLPKQTLPGPKGLAAVRLTTVFDLVLLGLALGAALLDQSPLAPFGDGRGLALFLITACMAFSGYISPRLPFNRHTGLRLPWTVRDPAAWNAAHRTLGYVSLPLALLYVGAGLTVPNFEAVTFAVIALWLGIPGLLSLAIYRKHT